ncbi:hypothetical protein BKA93DRAFT_741518, partial [Sparassis latifolia]
MSTAQYRLKGEIPNKYWSNLNKERKPRDRIFSLRVPNSNPPEYIHRSDKMAELARNYHNDLQSQDNDTPADEREAAIITTQEAIEQIAFIEDRSTLGDELTQEDVHEALKHSANGRATGLNGIPYELWKWLEQSFIDLQKQDKPAPNIILILTAVYNDIHLHEVVPSTDFATGW